MPKIVDVAEKRKEILAAARTVFARRGTRGTNLQTVAARAGIGKSSIYHYFPTRDALFDGVVRSLLEEEAAVFEDLAAAGGKPSERFDRLMQAMSGLVDDWVKAGPLLIDCLREESGRRIFARTLRRIRTALVELIEDGQRLGEFRSADATALATVVMGALDGILLLRIVDPTSLKGVDVAGELREVLRRGLRGEAVR